MIKQRPKFCRNIRKGKNIEPLTPFEKNYKMCWKFKKWFKKKSVELKIKGVDMNRPRFTDEQRLKIQLQWHLIEEAQDRYIEAISEVEATLQEQLGINIELFYSDGSICGVGSVDREYELLHMPDCKYYEEL